MPDHPADSLNLGDYLRPLRSRWWLVLVIAAIATAGTYVYYAAQPSEYSATTTLFLERAALGGATLDPDRDARNRAVLLKTVAVAREVGREIGYRGNPRDLLTRLSVSASEGTDFLTLTTSGTDPLATARLTNAFARAYTTLSDRAARARAKLARVQAERRLAAVLRTPETQATRAELTQELARLRVEETSAQRTARQLEPAAAPSSPTGPNPRRNALFALVLSAVIAMLLAYGLELLDRRVNRIEDVSEHYGRPALVAIPRARAGEQNSNGGLRLMAPFVEPFRTLRTALQLHATDPADEEEEARPLSAILVTSAIVGEGKSTVARNLALAYLEAGVSVALVDADLRRPSLAADFGLSNEPGLADVLSDRRSVGEVMRVVRQRRNGAAPRPAASTRFGLTLVSSGKLTGDPAALLGGSQLVRVISLLRASHEVVIIDSPPLLAVSDAVALLAAVDGVLLVTRLRTTPISAVEQLNDLLERVRGANILGVVANDALEPTGYGYDEL